MLTAMPQMMQISHKPKVAPATLSAATHPVPKKIIRAVPRNSATHCPVSVGCFSAMVMDTSFLFLSRHPETGMGARYSCVSEKPHF
ncbi:hypothetical protein [Pseudomonas savastanoi]|uniref:hypothetical protein n=1 Tax=Pseudomonas savastanoi TaxID=29438 RepID=UPI001F2BA9E5|nr:hypothetical protein [Pseudomonas savastanoi]